MKSTIKFLGQKPGKDYIMEELKNVEKAYEESKYLNDKIRLVLTKLETLRFLKETNSITKENIKKEVEKIKDDDLVVVKAILDNITDLLDLEL